MLERLSSNVAAKPLSVRGLTLEIDGERLIDGIDLELSEGGVTVVLGFNGAGKSLLLRLLHGLIEPTAGEIKWGGEPLNAEVRNSQAMVFQKPVLLRRSVAANMDFVLSGKGGKNQTLRDEALEQVGLLDLSRRPARSLSGGEQQRLALARALACAPDVLFLDEATANLDPASVATIEQLVCGAAQKGVRVVFVTHDIQQARRIADQIVFLDRGKLCEHSAAKPFFAGPKSEVARGYLDGRLIL